jgi:hypothetical protein
MISWAAFLQRLPLDQPAGQLDLLQNFIRDLAVIGIARGGVVRLRRLVSALLKCEPNA